MTLHDRTCTFDEYKQMNLEAEGYLAECIAKYAGTAEAIESAGNRVLKRFQNEKKHRYLPSQWDVEIHYQCLNACREFWSNHNKTKKFQLKQDFEAEFENADTDITFEEHACNLHRSEMSKAQAKEQLDHYLNENSCDLTERERETQRALRNQLSKIVEAYQESPNRNYKAVAVEAIMRQLDMPKSRATARFEKFSEAAIKDDQSGEGIVVKLKDGSCRPPDSCTGEAEQEKLE